MSLWWLVPIAGVFIGLAIGLHRWTRPNDDRGEVSGAWLAQQRGKRDGGGK